MSKKVCSLDMEALVSKFHHSGLDQKTFAENNGISKGKLHYWIKKMSCHLPPDTTAADPPCNFIPLELAAPFNPRSILIRCANGIEIEIPL